MFVHGDNISQKENSEAKYSDNDSKKMLSEIRQKYDAWKNANLNLVGPSKLENEEDESTIAKRVKLLNEYKDYIDQKHFAEKFDSRSNLHSSIIEEFMYYLFRDLVASISSVAFIGKSHAFKDIFFRPNSYTEMLTEISIHTEKKDFDFTIGTELDVEISISSNRGKSVNEKWQIPSLAIECKTYLDKTMLQDASTAAEQLQLKNPNAKYIVVAEWLKLTESVNLKKYKIDQIYILRKQKNTDREFRFDDKYVKNPIHDDVVLHLFKTVRTHLTENWSGEISTGLNRGFLI